MRESILVCILPDICLDSRRDALRIFLINTIAFANQFDADIDFFVPVEREPDLQSILSQASQNQSLKQKIHPISGEWPTTLVGNAVKLYNSDLVVVPTNGFTDETDSNFRLRKTIFEQTVAPVLAISPRVDLNAKPVNSVLVPMSGEIRISSALEFGMRLACQVGVPVDLLHVVTEVNPIKTPLDSMGDQPQHEYHELLARILAEACPFSDTKERAQVRNLYHTEGVPSVEILKTISSNPHCLLVIQWQGVLSLGRAETLKALLHEISVPIILIRAATDQESVLTIGPETRVA